MRASSGILKELAVRNDNKILLLVMDGLGDIPNTERKKTALELAKIPNLDKLAKTSETGVHYPIAPGITPGSAPAHLGIFGYDPISTLVGRGTFGALGVGFELKIGDLSARINFCSLDKNGVITDRRAGRIPTEKGSELVKKLSLIKKIEDVEVFIRPEKEYRAVVVFRGPELDGNIYDTDPQITGVQPLPVRARDNHSARSARIVSVFIDKAMTILKDEHPANGLMLRGFDKYRHIESFEERYKMKSVGITSYPTYKGISRLVGMDVIDYKETPLEGLEMVRESIAQYDFIFFHIKKTDSYGEDGNIESKSKIIESVDNIIPDILSLGFSAIAITGDHSTPAKMKSHSWHPVPILINSKFSFYNDDACFNERSCMQGSLGRIYSTDIMPLLMNHGGRINKFGA